MDYPGPLCHLAPRSRLLGAFVVYLCQGSFADMHVTSLHGYTGDSGKVSAGFPTWFVVVILGPTFSLPPFPRHPSRG